MFDFRYHVASLIAVFIALVIGILVGIGLSGRGFVSDAERKNLESRISDLTSERDAMRAQVADALRRESATDHYADDTFAALVRGRLADKRIAVVFVGSVDTGVESAVADAVRRAGGRIVRVRALRMPLDVPALERAIGKRRALQSYSGPEELRPLGRDIGSELVFGGRTPLLDALGDVLLEEREGSGQQPVDAVVIRRSAPAQQGATHEFLTGLYGGLAGVGIPAVGVEPSDPPRSTIPAFARSGLSTIDSVDTTAGKVALVLELAGASPGHYGVGETASDGLLPPVTPLAGP